MPEITDQAPAVVAAELATLRDALDAQIPSKSLDRNLLLATWNLRAFGGLTKEWVSGANDSPKRDLRSLLYITEIVSRFDIVAIQEVKGNIRALRHMLKRLNQIEAVWSVILTDESHGDVGNNERLAFLFDTRRVQLSGLAAELVVPAERAQIAAGAFIRQFARTPYAVAFHARGKTFVLVTLHVLYGDAADRTQELNAIAVWLRDWARQMNSFDQNLIALGDFNIPRLGDDLFNAFTSTGLQPPAELEGLPRTVFGAGSSVRQADQIAWFLGGQGTPGLSSLTYTGQAGIFDYVPHVLVDSGLTLNQKTFRVSDHHLLWAAFTT